MITGTVRFIPTYVGHTPIYRLTVVIMHGSSPPTWGIQLYESEIPIPKRFIPTYVGHTPTLLAS